MTKKEILLYLPLAILLLPLVILTLPITVGFAIYERIQEKQMGFSMKNKEN